MSKNSSRKVFMLRGGSHLACRDVLRSARRVRKKPIGFFRVVAFRVVLAKAHQYEKNDG